MALVFAALVVLLQGPCIPTVAAITTTDSLLESTHTPLPVTLAELDPETSPTSDLSEAETKDPQRLEIIKQIRKVNQDGSYTVGYEAEDGTFKIESRDVLGNIKGTYGYIDVNGDIKRVSYGGSGQPPRPTALGTTISPSSTTEEDVVHIPPRFNRSQQQQQHQHQHHQLLVPTTRRPPNYQPPQHHLPSHTPQHASTLRPSVIQTIPRKRPGYPSSTTTTSATTAAHMSNSMSTTSTTTAATTMTTPMSTQRGVTESMTTPKPTAETGGSLAGAFGEPTTASSHMSSLHSKPQSTVLIIRPTPLPYQTSKTAEQLARPERLEGTSKYGHLSTPSKKPVRGNFLRRQLAAPAATVESGEQYEAQQQQIVYGQSDGDLGSIFTAGGGKPLYTTHPAPRIPAAVLAARQRAAQIQSALQVQAGQSGGPSTGERSFNKERVYAKQPVRPTVRHEGPPAQVLYESSTEPSLEHGYVTDGPGSASVVQIPAANRVATVAASEAESEIDERRPIFRPRPVEFRPREAAPQGRYRTPYGLPPPQFTRSFTPLPPPQEGLPYATRVTENSVDDGERDPDDAQQQYQNPQISSISPYRQQRRLTGGGLPLPSADTGYGGPRDQGQQQQNSYPIPVPFNPGQYPPTHPGARSNPYYYDIPAERPLTARDFERILQLLIFRHQQLQQASRYRAGGYYGGYNGGFPYNPYYPGPSPSPFGLGGPYNGGYPQQQIPRPPLPYPYGSPYDHGLGYQNPLYSPSAPSSSMHPGPEGEADGGYGQPAAARRHGQYFRQPALDGAGAGSNSGSGLRAANGGDYLPPEVRESLLYRMLMLAIQTSGSNEVLPLAAPTGPSSSQLPHLAHHLQGASSVPRPQTQSNHRMQTQPHQQNSPATVASSAATPLPMFSKKPVRSVQILGEE
ncbi:AGAP000744-PA-like protein [Anopheles sinensis]|uniref:AGAP000744-PA-like protein n=1 Tax=Anopheles sinensis TaxID=74873 RepID=A0A084VVG8_ANOSI|nr:AGAP000744-PA-like protein [Anopheles sinensis]